MYTKKLFLYKPCYVYIQNTVQIYTVQYTVQKKNAVSNMMGNIVIPHHSKFFHLLVCISSLQGGNNSGLSFLKVPCPSQI